jgi:hypothetical protein
MDAIWLLQGGHEAPGWGPLEADARAKKIDVLLFDRDAWALIRAAEPPTAYEGLQPGVPRDGLYLDNSARSIYLVAGRAVDRAEDVLATLGPQAQELLAKLGDGDVVLDRLGRVY